MCAALAAVALVLSQALAYVGVAPQQALADWVPQTIYIGSEGDSPRSSNIQVSKVAGDIAPGNSVVVLLHIQSSCSPKANPANGP